MTVTVQLHKNDQPAIVINRTRSREGDNEDDVCKKNVQSQVNLSGVHLLGVGCISNFTGFFGVVRELLSRAKTDYFFSSEDRQYHLITFASQLTLEYDHLRIAQFYKFSTCKSEALYWIFLIFAFRHLHLGTHAQCSITNIIFI
jgi:hypothetical protein